MPPPPTTPSIQLHDTKSGAGGMFLQICSSLHHPPFFLLSKIQLVFERIDLNHQTIYTYRPYGQYSLFFCCILFLPALSPICVAQIYVEAIYKSGLCSYSPSNKLHRSFCHGRWQRRFFYAPSNGSGLPPPPPCLRRKCFHAAPLSLH